MVLVSVRVGTSMKWTRLSPAVPTKKMVLSGLKIPASGAVAVPESFTALRVPAAPKVEADRVGGKNWADRAGGRGIGDKGDGRVGRGDDLVDRGGGHRQMFGVGARGLEEQAGRGSRSSPVGRRQVPVGSSRPLLDGHAGNGDTVMMLQDRDR